MQVSYLSLILVALHNLMACTNSSSSAKSAPNGITQVGLGAPLNTNTGVCNRLRLTLLTRNAKSASSQNETYVFNLTSSSSGGTFHNDDQCATVNPTVIIGERSTYAYAFYRDTASGNPQLKATYDGSFDIAPGKAAITVLAAPAGVSSGT